MARVRSIAPGAQRVSAHPSEVDCYWQLLVGPRGEQLVHLSTFGSDDRQSKPKSSQSLQLDRSQAQQLLGVLATAFPGLVAQADSELVESDVPDRRHKEPVKEDGAKSPRNGQLASALRESAAFREQWTLAGRVSLAPEDVTALIGTLAVSPRSRLPLDAVATTMGISPTRLQGALATLEKILNVEGYPVLHAADAHLILDVPLLREQFHLS